MIFRPDLAKKVMAGEKTATRRAPSPKTKSPWYWRGCIYKVGQEFAVQPGRGKPSIGAAIVDRVALERLGAIRAEQAVAEGFADIRDFIAAWREINGTFDALAWVWVVEFHVRP